MKFLAAVIAAASVLIDPQTAAPKPDFLAANMDTSASPGVDIFQYANGGWLKAHPIPASESHWGISNVVREEL